MKLHNYTLIFLILFGAMAFLHCRKAELSEVSVNRQRLFENACSEGVKAAAGILGTEDESETDLVCEIETAYFRAMAAYLSLETQPGYEKKLEQYVPVLIIVHRDCFEAVYASVNALGYIERKSHGREIFGYDGNGNRKCISGETSAECIAVIEEKISRILSEDLSIGNLIFDLPEDTSNAYIRSIDGPCVMAVAKYNLPNTGRARYAVYAAEVCSARECYVYEINGRREIHYSDCEVIGNLLHSGKQPTSYDNETWTVYDEGRLRRVSGRKEAAELGAYPAPCCDPLGAYCFDCTGNRTD